MRLAEIVAARPLVGEGVLVMLTRRCPLRCAHCATMSTMSAPHADAGVLRRFFDTFTVDSHPAVAVLTGGEPLLRPALVTELAAAARSAGTRTAVLTGAFFATAARIPAPVRRVAAAVDHFSISLDAYHEREVPRASVFRVLRELIELGVAVSLHVVGAGPDDPYLADATADVRRCFGTQVPMLVTGLRATGRAASWASPAIPAPGAAAAEPCAMAAWPVVTDDGTITACCNQNVVDGVARPEHLRLGHATVDGWPAVRERTRSSPVLRMLRTLGPRGLDARVAADGGWPAADYCGTCERLGRRPEVLAWARANAAGPGGALLDRQAAHGQADAGPTALVRRYGCAPYADLVDLDRDREPSR
ncbi:radical SAM protein [Phytohabitans sp. ZYX-F-186]|uniref:Radical SAM protein n=1 Tax=Phytohabitans maris TaxID=3071409 RepID=A0ABU0ZWF8_9ACTN|nr:radical SAM protein [Phytohabitans sp. ZYX-F-186]MDQ7911322.1 radical SAM protein [Phytohabitans sp. ZYX-F-186]